MLVKVAISESGDGRRGGRRSRRGGGRHAQAGGAVSRYEVKSRVGVNIIAMPKRARIGFPGMGSGRVKQEVLAVVEHVIGVAYEQHVVFS